MKNIVSKRGIFWTFVIGIFILTPLFTFLLDQRGYKTPDNYEDIWPRKMDTVLYGKENPSGDASAGERLMSYNLLSPSENNEERAGRPGGSRKTGELEGRLPSQANHGYERSNN